jgi:hypothetical protein
MRAAWWAFWSARRARTQLREGGLDAVRLQPPPRLPPSADLGVSVALRVRNDTCLVRAAVRQRWHAAHGSPRDIVIGVRGTAPDIAAHAWLDGDPPCHSEGFEELLRRRLVR